MSTTFTTVIKTIQGTKVLFDVWPESPGVAGTKYGSQVNCPLCETVYDTKNVPRETMAVRNNYDKIVRHFKSKH